MLKDKGITSRKLILPIAAIIALIAAVTSMKQKSVEYQKDSGMVFGTIYNITYQHKDNLKGEIENALKGVDQSLSMFNQESVIARVNNNKVVKLDENFIKVFRIAENVNRETNGAFDITVAPLVNAWGFGFKNNDMPDKHQVDSLRSIIGMDKVKLVEQMDGKAFPHIEKTDDRVMLDCSAIAKGYGVDVVADLLRSKGITDFMVEIGGEVVTSGINPSRVPWKIGVVKPTDDSLSTGSELQTCLNVTDKAMATSGNYRNFYYKGGKKYAHTIDPKTGYPVQHNILSATVLAEDCATADAYATSFMVMGLEGAKKVLAKHKELMVYFIYSDTKGQSAVWFSPSLRDKIEGE